ncbi:MAG: hypothetical protein HN348_22670 [Proteobacteria bacterium]|nr:hypothetical protein [Pseudomonadota bacterium]
MAYVLFTPVAVWTSSGLATMPFTLGMFATTVLLLWGNDRRWWIAAGIAALGLALVRTEGIYWSIVICAIVLGVRWAKGEAVRRPAIYVLGILFGGYTPYFIWRVAYYRSLLANTAYAKVAMSGESLSRGVQYAVYYCLIMLSPVLWVFGALAVGVNKRRLEGLPFVALALGVPTWAVLVSGDYMAFFRLMVPGVPFLMISTAFVWEWLWQHPRLRISAPVLGLLAALMGVLPGLDVIIAPNNILSAVQTRLMREDKLTRQLNELGLDVDEREAYLFGMGEDFELKRVRNELHRFEKMKSNPYRWRVAAEVMRNHLKSRHKTVASAIGAFGYYSDIYIYDQNGLVSSDVARRDRSGEDDSLRWPGHDSFVDKDFFLDKKPDILDYEVVFPPRQNAKVRRIGDMYEKEDRKNYFAEVVPFSTKDDPAKTSYLVLQRRASHKDAKAGWRKFRTKYGGSKKKVDVHSSKKKKGDKKKGNKKPNAEFKPQDPSALPSGRWRTFTQDDSLTDAQREELEMLELIGYVSGSMEAEDKPTIDRFDPQKVQPGINLVVSGHGPQAYLMDMEANVLHTWRHHFAKVWPDYPGRKTDSRTYWRRVHLYENGDILAIFEGLGILRIDKDSKLLWANPNRAHHDIHIANNGDIYTLTRVARTVDRLNLDHPVLEDFVTILDPKTGEEKSSISVLEAFEASEFADVWRSAFEKKDIFHTNTIELLDGRIAEQLPEFAAGNVLLSMRNINAIAVMDLEGPEIVWALTGDFALQHDPKILDNGHMLLFNNSEGPASSVLELDLVKGDVVWEFEGSDNESFYTPSCGIAERLPNGNTLIVESDPGRAFELTKSHEIVWEFHNPNRGGPNDEFVATLFQVMRLPESKLPWLDRP